MADDGATGEESMPAFLRYGVFTIVVYVAVMAALDALTAVPVGGETLVAFTVGFSLFMASYFVAMWVGWVLLD
jgi:hypothetical protein